MAKNDNLTDFLTDIADTIRNRTGINEPINPQDFSSKIRQFNTLYVNNGVFKKAINFYDYDGTLLYSYSKEEFNELSELPPILYHENMRGEEWNWTFGDIISELDNFEILDVGINCTTHDGNTRLYTKIESNATKLLLEIVVDSFGDTRFSIDWGDGNVEEFIYTDKCSTDEVCLVNPYIDAYHTYRYMGNYCITITVQAERLITLGDPTNKGAFSNLMRSFYKIELGDSVNFSPEAFRGMICDSINIPKTYDGFLGYFGYLPFVSIPRGTETLPSFSNSNIEIISLPNTISITPKNSFTNNSFLQNIFLSGITNTYQMFSGCSRLKIIHLPTEYVIQDGMFQNCGLRRLVIPEGITTISEKACYNSWIEYLKIPSTIKTIGNSALSYMDSLIVSDLLDAVPSNFTGQEFYPNRSEGLIVVKKELWNDWFNKFKSNNSSRDILLCLTTDVYPEQVSSLTILAPKYLNNYSTSVDIDVDAIVNGYKITTGDYVENTEYKRYTALKSITTANTSATEKNIALEYTLNNKTVTSNIIQVGIGIQHIDGTLYSLDDWTTNSFTADVANGVSVSIGQHSFVIAKDSVNNSTWGGYGSDILTSSEIGQGENNNNTIISNLGDNDNVAYAAKLAKEYTFPNGQLGFLPSKNEMEIILDNLVRIINAFNLLGITIVNTGDNWVSSTQESSNYVYCIKFSTYIDFHKITTVSKNTECVIRPISYI